MPTRPAAVPPSYVTQVSGRIRYLTSPIFCLAAVACGDPPTVIEEPENPCTAAVAIALGETSNGVLSPSDCVQSGGAYADRYRLTLTSGSDVRIDLTSNIFDAFLELRDNSGNLIAENDDAGGLNSRIIRPLSAGSYIILARSLNSAQSGSYVLSVSVGPDCSPVGNLTLGVTATGTLAASDCLFEFGGLLDNWSLNLTTAGKLRIDLRSTDFDEVVLLRDSQGFIVNGADGQNPSGNARLETEVPAGQWTISVAAQSETARGPYELTVDVAPPCTPGTDFVLGTSVSGELTANDCQFEGISPADSFALTITQEAPISIHLKSSDFEPFVILQDQGGNLVGFGFDQTQAGSAFINMTLSVGSYALYVATTSFPPEGTYLLAVSEIACAAPQTVTFGQTVTGSLDPSDCSRAGGAFQESWELVLATDTTARIDMQSVAVDPFLMLKDSQGNVIITDDDGGNGLNARIEQRLVAGTYEIVASSFASGQIGAYQLTVADPPPPMLAPAGQGAIRSKAALDAGSVYDRMRRTRSWTWVRSLKESRF